MKKLLIKAPINSIYSTELQIESGAGELYGGFEFDYGHSMTFSGRAKKSCFDNRKTIMPYQDFETAVRIAHDNGVKVELVANLPHFNDCNFSGNNDGDKKYIEYIKMGIDAGVDRVIVGDLGNLIRLRAAGINFPVTASTFLTCLNKKTIKFLEEMHIEKVVLPHTFSLEEITEIVTDTKIKVEIFGHFGCSFLESTCGLLHVNDERLQTGIPCRAKFIIQSSGEEISILDVNEDCSLCLLDEVMKTGVESIKTIGRDLDPMFMAAITAVYAKTIDYILEGKSIQEILEIISDEMDFGMWENTFCKEKRCKYMWNNYII
ncbi:MAG: U32 family peptidase [Lachnospiraceae bacterium]|nr:U32 family peptidase [Lachnospiraceae bacterium]